jgi:hypothetical protein
MTDGYVHNLGTEYRGSSSLRLMDVQNNEITGTKIPMGKKVYLELSIFLNGYRLEGSFKLTFPY